jgi:2'-5' RNA ligase
MIDSIVGGIARAIVAPDRIDTVLTALVVAVPEASSAVDGWREQTSDNRPDRRRLARRRLRPSMGIPPHVTLLFPFAPAERVDESLDELRQLFAGTLAFDVSFRELRRFPELAYLAPEPPEPFASLTEAIVERWPAYPPYEGIHETVIPHLTVAYGNDSLLAEVEADVTPQLPIEAHVVEAVLLEERELDVRWAARARFPLGHSRP